MLRLPKRKTVVVDASLLKRFLAFVLDLLIIDLLIIIPFRGLLERIVPTGSLASTYKYLISEPPTALYTITFTMSFLTILYFVLLEKKIGQTVGKVLLNLYVVPTDKKEQWWRYVIRSIFLIPVFPIVLLWIIDPIYMLFNKQHQRLTEYLSKTKVVEKISW
jgi:uncharacterized RDD family membrane protein YckC